MLIGGKLDVTDDPNAAIRQPDPTPQADQPEPVDRPPLAPPSHEGIQGVSEGGNQQETLVPPAPSAAEPAVEQVIPPAPVPTSEPAIEPPIVVEPPQAAPALGEPPPLGEARAEEIELAEVEEEESLEFAPIVAPPAATEHPAVVAAQPAAAEGAGEGPAPVGAAQGPAKEGPIGAVAVQEAEAPATSETAPSAEAPQEPVAEAPKPEQARVEEPKPEVPKAEEAKAEEPKPEEPKVEEPKSEKMDWYILKVQSNREESIRDGLRKKIKIAGQEHYFGDIIIPTEKVTEFKGGKRKVFKRKLYPGYLVVQMELNDDTWYLVRDTAGIGDFTGAAGHPTPMQAREVSAILAKQEEKTDEAPKLKINFKVGDHVKIKEGTFENFEGEVANIDETNGRVTVLINIFGRSTPVDIEYWQVENV